MNLKPIYQAEADNQLIRAEASPYHAPHGHIAEHVVSSPDPILIQVSGAPCVTPIQHVLEYAQREYNELCQIIDSDLFEYMSPKLQSILQRQKLIMIDYLAVLNERVSAITT